MHDSDEDWIDDEPEEDQDDTMLCPECGAEIFDDVDVCPVCLHAIIPDTSPWAGKSYAWVFFGFLGIIATIVALIMLFP